MLQHYASETKFSMKQLYSLRVQIQMYSLGMPLKILWKLWMLQQGFF